MRAFATLDNERNLHVHNIEICEILLLLYRRLSIKSLTTYHIHVYSKNCDIRTITAYITTNAMKCRESFLIKKILFENATHSFSRSVREEESNLDVVEALLVEGIL